MAEKPELPELDPAESARRILKNNASGVTKDLEALAAALLKVHTAGGTTGKDIQLMAGHLSTAGKGADHLRKAAIQMSEVLVAEAGHLTESGREAHSNVAAGLRDLVDSTSGEVSAHNLKNLAAHNRARYDSIVNAKPGEHAANIRSNFLKGSFEALQGTTLSGNPMASKMADMMGAIFPAVEALGGFITAIALLGEVVKITSKNSLDAAKSGLEFDSSILDTGARFGWAADKAKGWDRAMSQDTITGYMGLVRGQGASLEGGASYAAGLGGSERDRNDVRLKAVDFVAALAHVGPMLGVGSEEAVKFGARITALSHGSFLDGQKGFYAMAAGAERLGITMDPLMGTFDALAEKADFAGESADDLVASTMAIPAGIKAMMAAHAEGFESMSGAKFKSMIQTITKGLMGIGDSRVAALTMTPGQSWEETLHKAATGNQFDQRRQAVLNAMKMAKESGQGSESRAFETARLLNSPFAADDLGNNVKFGHTMESLARTGDSAGMKKAMAAAYDEQFSSKRTSGELLAAGADPMKMLAATVSDLLKVIVELAEFVMNPATHLAGRSTNTDRIARDMSGQHAQAYGKSMGGYTRHASVAMS